MFIGKSISSPGRLHFYAPDIHFHLVTLLKQDLLQPKQGIILLSDKMYFMDISSV